MPSTARTSPNVRTKPSVWMAVASAVHTYCVSP